MKQTRLADDFGRANLEQYRIIEQIGNWYLLYEQHQCGNDVRHEFRIQKLKHDIVLCPDVSLEEAQQLFRKKVAEDMNETTETQQVLPSYREVVDLWNKQADEYNQWDELGEDEKIEWAMRVAIEAAGEKQ